MIFAVLVLASVAFFVRVNVTVPLIGIWLLVYVVALSLLLGSMAILFARRGVSINVRGGSVKKYGAILVGLFGFGTLVAFSIFLGVPKALHYLYSEERQITVRIAGKSNLHQGRRRINRCRNRLTISEFTRFPGNHLCVEKEIYETVDQGDYLLLTGDVSRFGVSVKAVHVVRSEQMR